MGIIKSSNYRLIWSQDPLIRIFGIANVMPRDRFELIKRHIYFSDLSHDSNDGPIKIRTIFDMY